VTLKPKVTFATKKTETAIEFLKIVSEVIIRIESEWGRSRQSYVVPGTILSEECIDRCLVLTVDELYQMFH